MILTCWIHFPFLTCQFSLARKTTEILLHRRICPRNQRFAIAFQVGKARGPTKLVQQRSWPSRLSVICLLWEPIWETLKVRGSDANRDTHALLIIGQAAQRALSPTRVACQRCESERNLPLLCGFVGDFQVSLSVCYSGTDRSHLRLHIKKLTKSCSTLFKLNRILKTVSRILALVSSVLKPTRHSRVESVDRHSNLHIIWKLP